MAEGKQSPNETARFLYLTRSKPSEMLHEATGESSRKPTYLTTQYVREFINIIFPKVSLDDLTIDPKLNGADEIIESLILRYTGSKDYLREVRVNVVTQPDEVPQKYEITIEGSSYAVRRVRESITEAIKNKGLPLDGRILPLNGIRPARTDSVNRSYGPHHMPYKPNPTKKNFEIRRHTRNRKKPALD